jgi:phytoene dehydrogenase-like protein
MAGIPICTVAGKGGGISLMSGYTFDKALLSDKEQDQVLFALQSLQAAGQGMDTQDLMDQFHHPLISATISDFCTKESRAVSFIVSYENFSSGDGGIFHGGSRAMAFRMKRRYEELGGNFHVSSP